MKRAVGNIFIILILSSFIMTDTFKDDQKRYSRVRKAYTEKESIINDLLAENSIDKSKLNIYLRAFKHEKKIELWGKNNSDSTYLLIKEYRVCRTSGELGPKRKQGDYQIPEGFYHIDRFNPSSNFYLSLGINYPNVSDKILGVRGNLGGDIFIHGACVTIGCLPITNDQIKELYVFCVEAKNSGQNNIPVTIFPAELTDKKMMELKTMYKSDKDKVDLWTDLKKGFEIFNKTKQLPNINFLNSGRHEVIK